MPAPSTRRRRRDRRTPVPPAAAVPAPVTPEVPARVLVPVVLGVVLAVLGGLAAWSFGTQVGHAQRLAEHGTVATAHDARGTSARGAQVSAVVDLPDGSLRRTLEGAPVSTADLADASFGQELGAAERPVVRGPYSGTFEVLVDGDLVMARVDVLDALDDDHLDRLAVAGGVVCGVSVAALTAAAVVAVRRDRRRPAGRSAA
ncbi:hypothetical protein ATJ88_3432 [Isoptericola jiangsuensis]|uniref:Uncharacterized protein n=1 Tax=Isoptericola jiangsuensis TaxID=548579 RepID=A0A2A9F1K3_9MICO|nr:hypothetical protein [Isoptericola jiangsuensis]PFG44696.1 hypothetical protein ATJ88_3432 [Isoptericola jiangsuensis]